MYRATIELPDALAQRFEALAQETGASPQALLQEAVEAYLDQAAADRARLAESIAQADRGDTVDAADVYAEAEALLLARGITPEALEVLRVEARAEAEAFYGVSLCD